MTRTSTSTRVKVMVIDSAQTSTWLGTLTWPYVEALRRCVLGVPKIQQSNAGPPQRGGGSRSSCRSVDRRHRRGQTRPPASQLEGATSWANGRRHPPL